MVTKNKPTVFIETLNHSLKTTPCFYVIFALCVQGKVYLRVSRETFTMVVL